MGTLVPKEGCHSTSCNTLGQDGDITPAFSGVLSTGKNKKGPKSRQDGYTTPTFLGIPSAKHRGDFGKGPNLGKMAT